MNAQCFYIFYIVNVQLVLFNELLQHFFVRRIKFHELLEILECFSFAVLFQPIVLITLADYQ